MSLHDPNRVPSVDPADAVRIVEAFLERCRAWAVDREIPARLRRVAETHDPAEAGKLHEWVAWERFVDHTLAELRDGTLDAWFTLPEPSPPPSGAAPLADECDPPRYSPGEETR